MVIRDDYKRGVSKEHELKKIIVDICKFHCNKNKDPYDIDLVINLHENKKILIEVEETSDRSWPSDSLKPKFYSKLLTMPIRKVKYFIDDFKKLEKKTIGSIEEFIKLYPKNTLFKSRNSKDEIRLYIKGNYNLKHLCVVSEEIIVKALNGKLRDQKLVDKCVGKLKKNSKWKFSGNLWYNPSVRNMKGEYRDDRVLLILGLIDGNNDLIWIEQSSVCTVLKGLIKSKWGIQQ